jgi:hypothetical protein
MISIYILRLDGDKYYIGGSEFPDYSIENHFNKKGVHWTMNHEPLNVIELIYNCDSKDIDMYVIKYMEEYGIDNVRGGSFSNVILSESQLNIINYELNNELNNKKCQCIISAFSFHHKQDCMLKDSMINKKIELKK